MATPTNKIRVMVVEDSHSIRAFLEHVIGSDPRLRVVASVASAEEALRILPRVSPDVISMDIHLPGINGYEATARIMNERPTPIVVVSGSVRCDELNASMNALRAGALAVMEKPVGTTHEDYAMLAERLCTQLAIMSQVKVVRQRFNGSRRRRSSEKATAVGPRTIQPGNTADNFRIVGMVASTGGPSALQAVLSALPASFPVPIVLVQHITANFHAGFVHWLDANVPLRVVSAMDGKRLEAGTIFVAPPDVHLTTNRYRLNLNSGELVCAQRPSGTVLLESLARSFGNEALGVVLTGMGEDGAAGLAAIRQAGGYTIAEDESTAIVYGMPAAADRMGAVRDLLPLPAIGRRIVEMIPSTAEVL